MTYQLPTIKIPEGITAPTSSTHPLPIGKVVNVQIVMNQEQNGIMLNGKFVPARLPENLEDGSILAAKVTGNKDQLILKLLPPNQQPNPLEVLLEAKFQSELIEFLGEQDLERVKTLLKAVSNNQNQQTVLAAKDEISSTKYKELSALLDKNLFLSDKVLKEPAKVFEALINLNAKTGELLKNLNATHNAIDKLAAKVPSTSFDKFVQSLNLALEQIVQFEGNESAQVSTTTEGTQVRNPAPTRVTRVSNNANIKTDLDQTAPTDAPLKNNLLPKTVALGERIVDLIDRFISDKNPPEESVDHEVRTMLINLKHELPELVKRGDSQKLVQFLNRFIPQLKLPFNKEVESTTAHEQLRSLNALENMVEAKESLKQINTLMGAIGEPVFVLFPFLADGLLSRIDLQFHKPAIDPEEEGGKNGGSKSFQRIEVELHLPAIGTVGLSLAHRPKELLLNLTVESDEVATFIKERITPLEAAFKVLGYEATVLNVAPGKAREVKPAWVRELTKTDIVVA